MIVALRRRKNDRRDRLLVTGCKTLMRMTGGSAAPACLLPDTRARADCGAVTTGQFLLAFVLAGGAGTAVFFHAERNRVRHPSVWASFVFLFLIVGLPSYVVHVRRLRRRR